MLEKEIIRAKARELGFTSCGFAEVLPLQEEAGELEEWLHLGMHAEMAYMEKYKDLRRDPRLLLEGAKTAVVVAMNYFPGNPFGKTSKYKVSRYAQGSDYHELLREKLAWLLAFARELDSGIEGRYFVDSGPVMEKAWARRAGLGWTGKNGLLLTRKSGSWVFLGILFLNRAFEPDSPMKEYCGNCTRCIDSCPTGAIVSPGKVNAGKCISYLTIEKKGAFESGVPAWDGWIFGCDSCQQVCPWNHKTSLTSIREFLPREEILNLHDGDWENMDMARFKSLFKNSAVKRAKLEGLKRNILWVKK